MLEIYLTGVAFFATALYLLAQDVMDEDQEMYSAVIVGVIVWPIVFVFIILRVIWFYTIRRRKKNGIL